MRYLHSVLCLLLLVSGISHLSYGQVISDSIRINQIGYYPESPKIAVVVGAEAGSFYIVSSGLSDTVFTGSLGPAKTWTLSGETARQADFSQLKDTGNYVLLVPGIGRSPEFIIGPYTYHSVGTGALKMYYYQRMSTPIEQEYAGKWSRLPGHPDTVVYIHESAATDNRPAGTVISSPRGWYDAGDYNKYIVNSGISTYTLLALFEHFPEYMSELRTNIPESANGIPDVLDEVRWNLRWMLTMQDPHDGGVYHKCTHPNFTGFFMPHRIDASRYVVQKSSTATLDFAAVMAQAGRVYEDYLPGFADSCLTAAERAWNWAQNNPDRLYDQNALNEQYDPDINTGEYGDWTDEDETRWAAIELFISTGNEQYLDHIPVVTEFNLSVPNWMNVEMLGVISLLQNRSDIESALDFNQLEGRFLHWADELMKDYRSTPYGVVMGQQASDFVWGSNGVAGNQAMALMQAYRLTREEDYLNAVHSNLDYLLGRNATGYSFATGYGDKTPSEPHHRVSGADQISAPIPGMIVGGPNPGQQDAGNCPGYPSDQPANSYIDHECSYASNEITINWNAPFVYITCALEAEYSATGKPLSTSQGEQPAPAPSGFRLEENYPNPFNPRTRIEYHLSESAHVHINIVDITGQKVTTLINVAHQAGSYIVEWNGNLGNMKKAPSGVYFCKAVFIRDNRRVVRTDKMLLLR